MLWAENYLSGWNFQELITTGFEELQNLAKILLTVGIVENYNSKIKQSFKMNASVSSKVRGG